MNYEDLDRKRELAIALKRSHTLQLRECFDPINPESRPTVIQEQILRDINNVLFQYVQGGNQSGKTATASRVYAWLMQGHHPYWDFRALWPEEPLLMLLMGRLNNQVEEIWERKIKPFLQPHEFRENRQGGTLQYVVNPTNKHKIVFATHNNPVEAREKVQSYSAHMVWLDELTDHLPIIEELQRRVQAKRGRMMITYTPKIRAEAVKKFIENPTPYSKIYRISMLDNPVYDGRREELMSQIDSLPESQRNTILYGDWYVGEQAVFSYDPDKHNEQPKGYSVLWPHIISVDPAASGLMGMTTWAAPDANAHRWYCVHAEYLKGAAPSDLVLTVEEKNAGRTVIYRICDTHESWFIKEAAKHKIIYRGVPNKHSRKKELIAGCNQALANERIKLTSESSELGAEFSTAQWSETVEDKIVNASRYHLADTAQYFVDLQPKFKSTEVSSLTHDQQLWLANKKRKELEGQRKAGRPASKQFRIVSRGGQVWRRSS